MFENQILFSCLYRWKAASKALGAPPNEKFILQFSIDWCKYNFDGQTLTKRDLKGRLQIFFSENMFPGGKQTIRKVLAASIVKICHPRTS